MNRIMVVLLLLSPVVLLGRQEAEQAQITTADLLELKVGNYVHGFKEFDTSVTAMGRTISIGIYWDLSTQSKERAHQLKKRFERHIPSILKAYGLAESYDMAVTVYSEDRTGRSY